LTLRVCLSDIFFFLFFLGYIGIKNILPANIKPIIKRGSVLSSRSVRPFRAPHVLGLVTFTASLSFSVQGACPTDFPEGPVLTPHIEQIDIVEGNQNVLKQQILRRA
jgi:hypothetical protein